MKIPMCLAAALLLLTSLPALAAEETPKATLLPQTGLLSQQVSQKDQPAPSFRIGYVDLIKVREDSLAGKGMKERLQSVKDKFQSQIDAKRKSLEKFKASTESKLPSMTPQQRAAKAKEFDRKMEDFQNSGRKAEKELMEQQDKESLALFNSIEKVATSIGREKGFSVVLVKRELLYMASGIEVVDVTPDVIKQMDSEKR